MRIWPVNSIDPDISATNSLMNIIEMLETRLVMHHTLNPIFKTVVLTTNNNMSPFVIIFARKGQHLSNLSNEKVCEFVDARVNFLN